jgi:hypothetical protein
MASVTDAVGRSLRFYAPSRALEVGSGADDFPVAALARYTMHP